MSDSISNEQKDTNAAFYGQRIPAGDLLSGKVPAPEAASALYTVVESAESIDETALPENSFVVCHPFGARNLKLIIFAAGRSAFDVARRYITGRTTDIRR